MFHKARFRLTLLYSLIFLILFWGLSAGVYEWMNGHFGDKQRKDFDRYEHQDQNSFGNLPSGEPPSDIIMDDLRDTLIILDTLLLILVPTITWFLTGRTLAPVEEAHKREKQFFTDASHDLRTPLTILKGEIDLSLKKDHAVKEYKKTLQSNKEEVARLIELVENMLFFARENKLNQTMQKERLDLTDIIAERVSKFQTFAKQKQQNLSFTLPNENVTILGNKQLLQRLLTSLLDNAVKYTPAKGKISITLSQNKQYALISISDTGVGIANEQQEKVFDRFYRADSARSQKGYGLGLSIVKQIMDFHEGKISLNSKEGHGTKITISFPLSTQSQGKSQS